MTKQDGFKLLKKFKEQCNKDTDPYFVCHFSRVDDRFEGDHNGMDEWDAVILISQLIKDFNLNRSHIEAAFSNNKYFKYAKS